LRGSGIDLMKSAPAGRAIIQLALPMMVAMLAQSIHSMTDIFFIGQTGNPDMLAAVSLAFPLFMLSQALGNIFAVGGSSYISRLLGANKIERARHTSAVSLYTVFGLGVILAAVLFCIKTPMIWLIGASDATFSHTSDYFSVLILFVAFAAASVAMSGKMRSEGAADKALILQLIGIVTNVILSPILILGFGMGTQGAAWATGTGQMVSFGYGVYYFLSKKTVLSIRLGDWKPDMKMMLQVLSVGLPSGLSIIIMSASNVLGNRVLAGYGEHVIAGNGVQMRISSMFFMMVLALVQGYQPFAGYNYGAGQLSRVSKGFKVTLIYSFGLCLAGTIALRLLGEDIIRLFINDEPTIEAGVAIMKIFVLGLPFIGPQMTLMVSFQALGKPVQAMIITMGRQLLFYIPLLYLLSYQFGFEGLVWAQPGADMLTTGISVMLGLSLIRIMRKDGKSNSNWKEKNI